MQKPSLKNETPAENQEKSASLRPYLFRVASGVGLIILLPMVVMALLERHLGLQLDVTDKGLIHFMLFIFFFAYLFILGFDFPIQKLQDWRRQMEKRLSSTLEKTDKITGDKE